MSGANPSGSERQVASLYESIEDADVAALSQIYPENIADLYVYEGFDPQTIYSLLRQAEPNDAQFHLDMVHLAIIFLMRGNNIDKIAKSVKPEGKVMIEKFKKKYSIISGIDKNNRRESVTLARINMTLPLFGLKAMSKLHRSHVQVIRSELGKLHCLLRVPSAAAYFTEAFADHVYWLYLAYAAILGSVIGDDKDTLGGLKRFVLAAQNARKIGLAQTRTFLYQTGLHYKPAGWEPLKKLLGGEMDALTLKTMAPQILSILDAIVPPTQWAPWVADGYQGPEEGPSGAPSLPRPPAPPDMPPGPSSATSSPGKHGLGGEPSDKSKKKARSLPGTKHLPEAAIETESPDSDDTIVGDRSGVFT